MRISDWSSYVCSSDLVPRTAINCLRMRLAAPILKRGLLPSPPAGRLASRIDAPDRDMSLMSLQFVGTLGQNSIGRRPASIGFTPAGRATSAIAHRVLPAVDRSDRRKDRKSVV